MQVAVLSTLVQGG